MKDFERFKRKVLREHIAKSILVGIGGGLLAAALAVVVAFLTNPSMAVGAGIIAGVLIGGFLGVYYGTRAKPTDKAIALRLDKKLGLHEKCATMIEFRDKEDALVNKQREDTQVTLAEKPTKALKYSVGVWVVPALVIASAAFTASLFTPKNTNNSGFSIVESSADPIDVATSSLGDKAKSYVDNSGIDSQLQSIFDSIIDRVTASLSGVTDTSERSDIVDAGKSDIDEVVDNWNSKEEIGKALKTEADQHLKNQGQHLVNGDVQGLRQDFQDMFDDLDSLSGQPLTDYANELADQIEDALAKAKMAGVSEDDDLYQIYQELADMLRHITDPTDSQPQNSDAMESVIADAASKAASNVNKQNSNEQVASIIKSIMDSMVNPTSLSSDSIDSITDTIVNTEGTDDTTTEGPTSSASLTTTSASTDSVIDTSMSIDPEPQPGPVDSGDSTGDGPAGPGQSVENSHTDVIYTGDDVVEYGSVIDSYGGDYIDDRKEGDGDDDDTADDYFKNLYGIGDGSDGNN